MTFYTPRTEEEIVLRIRLLTANLSEDVFGIQRTLLFRYLPFELVEEFLMPGQLTKSEFSSMYRLAPDQKSLEDMLQDTLNWACPKVEESDFMAVETSLSNLVGLIWLRSANVYRDVYVVRKEVYYDNYIESLVLIADRCKLDHFHLADFRKRLTNV